MLEVTFKMIKGKCRDKNGNTSGYCSFVIGASFRKLGTKVLRHALNALKPVSL
jgi:hypothetical protein